MKVKLLPSHLLTRLEETRSDETRWITIASTFAGAILGFIADFAISGQKLSGISPAAIVVIIAFVIGLILAAIETWRHWSRAKLVRKEMMQIGPETKAQLSTVEPISDEGETA